MSANIFPFLPPKTKESKIPIASSPIMLRRSASMRFKNNNNTQETNQSTTSQVTNRRRDAAPDTTTAAVRSALLKRGNSFMERGRHGSTIKSHVHISEPPKTPSRTTPRTPTTPQSPSSRNRSLSLSLSATRLNTPRSPSALTSSPKTPPTSPDIRNLSINHLDWDNESVTSINSVTSVGSCDHASVARNGTTFSGRSMKYVFHCNQHAGATGEDYLTPTQRVHRQVKKLKYLLHQAKQDLEQKDSDILKLTKEVVELRLYKAALSSPEDKSNSSDAVTVRENTDEQITPEFDPVDNNLPYTTSQNEMSNSYTDSGHFEDLQDGDSSKSVKVDKAVDASFGESIEHNQLIIEYEKRLQELVRAHEEESYQLKQKHNDKVEELLQRITEINKRYWELVPELDLAKEKIKELEAQLEETVQKLQQQEEKQKNTYLQMYNQGHEAARLEQEKKVMDIARQGPSRISVPELLQELQVTKNELDSIKDLYASPSNNLQPCLLSAKEALALWVLGARKAMYRQLMDAKNKSKIDPEITLQFLKSAVYYFLTDKENTQGHLKAIQSILGFSQKEIENIDKAMS